VAKHARTKKEVLEVGNIDSMKDWGYAPEYIEAMWKILNLEKPDDFVLATGESHSVREFICVAFKEINIEIVWEGEGLNEVGKDKQTGAILIQINPTFYRKGDFKAIVGDALKAKTTFGFDPKVKFHLLVKKMVEFDLLQGKSE